MGIDLSKGGRINLAKEAPALKNVTVGLGWAPNQYNTGTAFDLDASVFLCSLAADGTAKLISDDYFIFYNQPRDPEGAVVHSGDSKDGANNVAFGDGIEVDELVTIDLSKLNPNIGEISFIVTIHDADGRKQNFGQVTKSVIALRDDATGKVIGKYELEDDFSSETAVQFGSLYKKDGNWMFKAVGAGFKKGLADFVVAYGGTLA